MEAARKDGLLQGAGGRSRGGWIAFAVSAAVILGSLPATWFFYAEPVRDETDHIPMVRRWVHDPASVTIADFPGPKGIALFAASAAWGRLFGTGAVALRSMILLPAIAALLAWMELVRLWGLSRRFAAGLSLLAVPYFFTFTQMLYTEVPALLLTFLGLICIEKLRGGGRWAWGLGAAVSLGLLLWVRQTFLVVPVAVLLCSPWMRPRRAAVAAWTAAACLALVPMLVLWGGIVPPGQIRRFGGGGVYPDVFAFVLAVMGAVGWPALLTGRPQWSSREGLFWRAGVALAVLLYATQPLDYTGEHRMGLLQKALISLPLAPALPGALLLAAICLGGAVLGRLAYQAVSPGQPLWLRQASMMAVLCMGAYLVATPVFYDRYLILAWVMIFVMAAERASRPAAWAFLAVFALIAVAHAAYITRHPTPSPYPVPLASREFTTGRADAEARRKETEKAAGLRRGQDVTGDNVSCLHESSTPFAASSLNPMGSLNP